MFPKPDRRTSHDRRSILALLGGAVAVGASPLPAMAAQDGGGRVRITLLGTAGGPPPHFGRSQPASLIEIGDKAFLIDAGENVAQQLIRAGVPSPRLSGIFLTHLHWDHTLGLDYLMATGWMMGRTGPLPIQGPPGTVEFVRRTLREVELGEAIFRVQSTDRPRLARLYPARDIKRFDPHVVLEDGPLRISAVENSHFAELRASPHSYGIDRALSYRFDTPAGAVVFTGDTGPSETLTRFAQGAAVLVSEIVDLPSMQASLRQAGNTGAALDTLMQHMEHQHLTPEAVGRMATAAGVGKLLLTHFVVGRSFDPQLFAAQVKPHFAGEIIVGKDLAQVTLGG